MSSEKNQVMSGLAWKFSERISTQGVTFILQVVLARLLLPEQYGVIAMINVFIALANVFVVSGFSTSLIQKKDADDLDFSTIFYCSLIVAGLLYSVLFFAAPYISDFYNMPLLTPVMRVYSLSLILYSYNSVQQAYVSRHMMFRKFFYSTLSGTIISGIAGVVMAYLGYGVWALVAQYLLNIIINSVVLRGIIEWRPRWIFSWNRAKKLMKYGSNILGASLIGQIFDELRQLLIGKYFTPADLAFFNRGRSLPHLVSSNIDSSINQVLFPAMSNHSDNPEEIKRMTRRSIKVSSYVMYFFMTLLAVASKPIIILLLTEKWEPAVPYMQMICISSMVAIMSTANMQAIKASGRSDILLKLEFWKKPVFLLLLIFAVRHSVMAVALTMPLYSIYAAIVNMLPNKKILGYGISEQLRDQMPAILLSIACTICALPILNLSINDFVIMFLQIIVCTLIYIGGSILFKVETYRYIKETIIETINRKRQCRER